jgi:hypothetical protein
VNKRKNNHYLQDSFYITYIVAFIGIQRVDVESFERGKG